MISQRKLSVALTIMASTLLCGPALSEQQSTTSAGDNRFQLSASMQGSAQLSRSEMDRSSLGMGSLAAPRPRPQPAGNSLVATAPPAGQNTYQADAQSYLQEYNVDWSRWITLQADKWYYMLRSAEHALGRQFITPQAALIHYTCYADGTIGNVYIRQSSGVPSYDRLQVAALLASAPTAPFPAGTRRKSITLVQGWESHLRNNNEEDFQLGSFGRDFPLERVQQWLQPAR